MLLADSSNVPILFESDFERDCIRLITRNEKGSYYLYLNENQAWNIVKWAHGKSYIISMDVSAKEPLASVETCLNLVFTKRYPISVSLSLSGKLLSTDGFIEYNELVNVSPIKHDAFIEEVSEVYKEFCNG